MPQYGFGSGDLFSIVEGANRTPRKFGVLQEASIEWDKTTKQLHGQFEYPVAVAGGISKVMVRAKAAEIYGKQYAEIFFGDATVTSSQRKVAVDEVGTVPTTPFTVTVSNSATFLEDLGVIDASNGLAMLRVASAPATGQYSVSAGVYTFAAADTGKSVRISYSYTPASGGSKFTMTNRRLGTQSFFALVLTNSYDSDVSYVKLNRCTAKKLSLATKLEDFVIPEFECEAMVDAAGNLGEWGFSDQ